MLVSLTVALLTVAPGHVSLLASDVPALPSAARVLAQADALTPPPLPPRSPDEDRPEAETPDLRIAALSQQVRELTLRIDSIDTSWPGYAVVLMAVGCLLVGLPLTVVPMLLLSGAGSLLLPAGVVVLTGGAMMVGGYISGGSTVWRFEDERDRLRRERSRLKKELRLLKEQGRESGLPAAVRPAGHVPLLALAF